MATKVWSTLYTNTGPTGKSGVKPAITIGAGNWKSIRVPVGHSEGILTSFAVKQTSGTGVGFVVEILCSAIPYPVGESASATAAVGTVELYRVAQTVTATSGNAAVIFPDDKYGWPFRNVDGDWTNNQRYLYLVIKPTGAAGSTTWDASLTGYDGGG